MSGHYYIPIFSFEHIDYENKSEVLLSLNDMRKVRKKNMQSCKEVTQAVWTPHINKIDTATEHC